jgi:DNA-binding SARP family transcriptional activator
MFELRLFGSTEARTPGGRLSGRDFGGLKQRNILQLLALHGELSKSELAELLWEGHPPTEYMSTLESYVSLLRRRLEPASSARTSAVVTRNGGYALDRDRVSTDVGRFDRLLAAAARLDAGQALSMLWEAVALAEAPLLADEPYRTWAVEARERHRIRLVDAASRAAAHALALGAPDRAQELATRATDLDPIAETAWRVRMSAYRVGGDRGAALRCYETLRRSLSEELGVAPGPATTALFVEILRDDEGSSLPHSGELVAAVLAAARELAARDDPDGVPFRRVVQLLDRAVRLARANAAADPFALNPAG